jgi:nicotinamide-nucleotide amidase
MQAEIITIGDEILIGQTIDTNSAFIAKAFNKIGISIFQITSVQDDETHILKAFKEAEENADIVIITGGLGPTKDDITKRTICEYFSDTLVEDGEVLKNVEYLFETYIQTPISDINRQQALVPSKATVLMNKYGTAPGMWLEKGNKTFVSLPGVPYEMKALLQNEVVPRLREKYDFPHILHKTLLTYGLGESAIANRIESFEDSLPDFIKLAYLPSLGRVKLRLTAKGVDKARIHAAIEKKVKQLVSLVDDIFVGFEDDKSIEAIIGEKLTNLNKTLAVAESCTGGRIAQGFTSNAGASLYFKGSIVSYATEAKTDVLGISSELITRCSVVSREVAEAMAVKVKHLFNTDYAVSTTGNAGPEKGDSDADIGTVWIAVATNKEVYAEMFKFSNHREKVILKATNKAYEMLLKEISKK